MSNICISFFTPQICIFLCYHKLSNFPDAYMKKNRPFSTFISSDCPLEFYLFLCIGLDIITPINYSNPISIISFLTK